MLQCLLNATVCVCVCAVAAYANCVCMCDVQVLCYDSGVHCGGPHLQALCDQGQGTGADPQLLILEGLWQLRSCKYGLGYDVTRVRMDAIMCV